MQTDVISKPLDWLYKVSPLPNFLTASRFADGAHTMARYHASITMSRARLSPKPMSWRICRVPANRKAFAKSRRRWICATPGAARW